MILPVVIGFTGSRDAARRALVVAMAPEDRRTLVDAVARCATGVGVALLEPSGEPAGFVALAPTDYRGACHSRSRAAWYLLAVYVLPAHRSRGIGTGPLAQIAPLPGGL